MNSSNCKCKFISYNCSFVVNDIKCIYSFWIGFVFLVSVSILVVFLGL